MIFPSRLLAALLLAGPACSTAAPLVVALHRGVSSAGQAENNAAVIRRAVAEGAAIVEIDLRRTADGAIVVMHDPTVDRTTDGKGAVAAMTLSALKRLDAGGGETILTFAEALDLVAGSGTKLLLDLKRGGGTEPETIVATARARRALDRLIFGVRSLSQMRAYHALARDVPILGLVGSIGEIDGFAAAGASAIRLWPRWIFSSRSGCGAGARPPCLVRALQARGLTVWTTADAPADAARADALFRRLIAAGVDVVLTDRPRTPALIEAASAARPSTHGP